MDGRPQSIICIAHEHYHIVERENEQYIAVYCILSMDLNSNLSYYTKTAPNCISRDQSHCTVHSEKIVKGTKSAEIKRLFFVATKCSDRQIELLFI